LFLDPVVHFAHQDVALPDRILQTLLLGRHPRGHVPRRRRTPQLAVMHPAGSIAR